MTPQLVLDSILLIQTYDTWLHTPNELLHQIHCASPGVSRVPWLTDLCILLLQTNYNTNNRNNR